MRTNLCKFTVAFSGLSWASINFPGSNKPAPLYPKAWQVNEYLQEYYRRYIPEGTFQFRTTVTRAELMPEEDRKKKWSIMTESSEKDGQALATHIFDYLVAAPGCFSNPRVPDGWGRSGVPILHSTDHQRLVEALRDCVATSRPGRRFLVVGGSHSGSNVATTLALQISSLSDKAASTHPEVVFLSSRNMVALPNLLRTGDTSVCRFIPADLKLYNRSNLPADDPASFTYKLWNSEIRQTSTKMVLGLKYGADHSAERTECSSLQLNAVIDASFSEFVRYGMIKPVQATFKRLDSSPDNDAVAILETPTGEQTLIENIACVVFATGFDATASVSFLSEEVKALMGFDQRYPTLPLVLDTNYLSQNMAVPNLAVIGFVAQYWGAMEMQARAIRRSWTTSAIFPSEDERKSLAAYWRGMRDAIETGNKSTLPPNPFSDYVGLMEQAARELGLERIDGEWRNTEGAVCPARFVEKDATLEERTESLQTMKQLIKLQRSIDEPNPLVSRAVFAALLGKWCKERGDRTGKDKAGRGEFHFRPRYPTDSAYDYEYLVFESCSAGVQWMVFRYVEDEDHITVWKTKAGNHSAAGILAARLEFVSASSQNGRPDFVQARMARGAAKDDGGVRYTANFGFQFSGTVLTSFKVENLSREGQPVDHVAWFRG